MKCSLCERDKGVEKILLLPKCKIKVAIESVILSVVEVLLQVVGAKPSSEATKGSRRERLKLRILMFIR